MPPSNEANDAKEEADCPHAKDRVSNDASEKVAAGKVATKKLAAREHAFEKPTKIDRKSSDIFFLHTKRRFEREGKSY